MRDKHPIEVFRSEEDKGYIAVVPALAGCSAWGKCESEAISEARDAIEAWIKAAKSARRPIPKPQHIVLIGRS